MCEQGYNGWANRETWAVALHINNDQGWQEQVLELTRNTLDGLEQDPPVYVDAADLTDAYYASRVGDAIRENVEGVLAPFDDDRAANSEVTLTEGAWLALQDVGSLWRVDWRELGATFIEDVTE